MTGERLDPARTCLLLFDLLEGHVNRDDATRSRFRPVIANAEALLHAARLAGAMVAYAHADHRADRATSARTLRDTDNRLSHIDPALILDEHENWKKLWAQIVLGGAR